MSESSPLAIDFTVEVVAAYVANNPVPAADLPALIVSTHAALVGIGRPAASPAAPAPAEQPSASEIRKSIRPDGLVSFIDGQARKTLKRHLTNHGLTPANYRARYGLPADYPMTSAAYSEARSALARAIGLGRPGAMAQRQAAE